ncbi:MAG: 50S ribosomal protein L31 [Anaerolineae bacterium]|nr:50S ribosomal protein L31 [Anaerolineae bacterium]
MKEGIHPTYYPEATVRCACGNTWTTGSTMPEIQTDVCSACHPFFTGEQRIVDSEGQVDRFYRRLQLVRERQGLPEEPAPEQ